MVSGLLRQRKQSRETILGINFGQSYASIAVIDKEGHPTCIANEEGERQIACAISYVGEQIYIGNGALPHLVKNGKNTIMGFRNLLGHTYDEVDHTTILTAPLLADSKTPAYTVDILVPPPKPASNPRSAAASGTATPNPAALEPVPSTQTITVPEVTSLFLSTLLTSATDFLGVKPTACVVSAPTWFTSAQHDALKKAAQDAGIAVLQVLDEAAAVLVGYRVGSAGEEEKRDKKVVVLDMGETSLAVSVVQVSEGEYTVLNKGRDDRLGGREFDNLLLKHFSKEFTKKTKVALDLPCGPDASAADKRADAKLVLAVEHTKRSLSASSGAATCAVESLKDGYDLSSSINRLRFDGLASGVYRQVGNKLTEVVKEAGLDLAEIDEILLAGASTLFTGLQQHLSLLVSPTTPVTSTIDPSEVIAIGCALQALHLENLKDDDLKVEDVLSSTKEKVDVTSAPIGLVVPGQESDELVVVVDSGAPLPVRRRVAIPVEKAGSVGLELWEGNHEVKVTKVERPPIEKSEDDDEEDEDDEEEEDEEIKTPITKKVKALGGVQVDVKAAGNLILEVVVQRNGGLNVKAWQEGNESQVDSFEV
uniref:Hsp71-like protein n=1 Tax=Kwoniella dejecticola CBS 10117 TaxID=1296121 RepID=A0A1A6ADA6_9TREE|nr:hsp71-like protein [Kwoniella dejecticola CBS 10117]OBR88046.1 hsp71-like protein [Kwoniella dejecticola CBS 10117]